jgi:hypothetical protein
MNTNREMVDAIKKMIATQNQQLRNAAKLKGA